VTRKSYTKLNNVLLKITELASSGTTKLGAETFDIPLNSGKHVLRVRISVRPTKGKKNSQRPAIKVADSAEIKRISQSIESELAEALSETTRQRKG
jgi:hypothetical protein